MKILLDRIKNLDDVSASLRPCHCILIDKEKEQVVASLKRMGDWEYGHPPGSETNEPGDFNMLTEMLGGNPVVL